MKHFSRHSTFGALCVLLFCLVSLAQGICCPWHATSDVKCACDDGGLVHPWECCSTGACNVFCCNCGGPCRKNNTMVDWIAQGPLIEVLGRGKREANEEGDPLSKFRLIDLNSDGLIDFDEALSFLSHNGKRNWRDGDTPFWFSNVDADQDGLISPEEFDSDINEELLMRFN